jgi:plastocyanin
MKSMGAPAGEKGGTWRKGRLPLAAPLLGIAVALSSAPSSAAGPTIEAAGPGSYGYYWQPSSAEVSAGGAVAFNNATAVPHGVTWKSGPEAPSCAGVPIDTSKTNWSGSCTFASPGTYAFVCTVHPTEMTGTITARSSGTPGSPPPPSGGNSESPLQGPASRALKLAKSQRGSSVRGSIALSQASSGGKLEVLLLARPASLSGAGRSALSKVGRLVRTSLKAGRVSFAVPLKSVARRALRRQKRLSLTVQVVVKPPGRAALTLKRGVVLHV